MMNYFRVIFRPRIGDLLSRLDPKAWCPEISLDLISEFSEEHMPGLVAMLPEGQPTQTYLLVLRQVVTFHDTPFNKRIIRPETHIDKSIL